MNGMILSLSQVFDSGASLDGFAWTRERKKFFENFWVISCSAVSPQRRNFHRWASSFEAAIKNQLSHIFLFLRPRVFKTLSSNPLWLNNFGFESWWNYSDWSFLHFCGSSEELGIELMTSLTAIKAILAIVIETIFISYSGIYAVIRVDFIPNGMLHFNNSFVGAKWLIDHWLSTNYTIACLR